MSWLDEALVFLAAAALVVPLSKRLGFGAVLGYLAAGIAIGPAGIGLIADVDGILHFSEIGVVFLLFVIGLELQPSRLKVMRKLVFGFGSAQVLGTGFVLSGLAVLLGIAPGAAFAIGFALALSSTAFVLQLLAEHKELGQPQGRAAFGVLLLQDIAIVPLIAVLPLLGGADAAAPSLWTDLLVSVAVLAAFVVGGHYLLRPLLRLVAAAQIQEIFTAAALLLVIGSALLMERLGLPMGLGAFLAGVLVADSEYRHQLETDIEPFKGLLLGLFFMAVGMSTNLELLVAAPVGLVGTVLALMAAKAAVLYALAHAFGLRGRAALKLGLVLSQGGEFGFVLFNLAAGQGLFGADLADRLSLIVTLSMAATPLLYMIERRLGAKVAPDADSRPFDRIDVADPSVVIAGFGRFGQIVARILNLSGIPFTALEINPNLVDFVKRYGNKIYYGDARRLDLLRSAHVERARVFVLAVDDVEASMKIAETVRLHFPRVALFARARDRRHAMKLKHLGAQGIIRDTLLSSVSLATDVLEGLGFSESEAARAAELFAEHDAKLLARQFAIRDDEQALIQSAKDSALQLRTLFESDAERSTTRRSRETQG